MFWVWKKIMEDKQEITETKEEKPKGISIGNKEMRLMKKLGAKGISIRNGKIEYKLPEKPKKSEKSKKKNKQAKKSRKRNRKK